MPSTEITWPADPHSRTSEDSQASFCSPASSEPRGRALPPSSQKTQRRHGSGNRSMVSTVSGLTLRPTAAHLAPSGVGCWLAPPAPRERDASSGLRNVSRMPEIGCRILAHDARRLPLPGPVRPRYQGDDRLGDPCLVRRGGPPRDREPCRRHALYRRPPLRRDRQRGGGGARQGGSRRPAVRRRPGRRPAPRGDGRADAARGHPRLGGGRGRHRRLPAGPRPAGADVLRPRRRDRGRGTVLRRRPLGLLPVPGRGQARAPGRRRARPGRAGGGARPPGPGGPAGQVPLHHPQLPQPGRGHPLPGAPRPGRRHRPPPRPAGPRGQPLRPARLRVQPARRAARQGGRQRRLPRHHLQDLRPRPAHRLGTSAPRHPRAAGAGEGGRRPQPVELQPGGRVPLLRRVPLAGDPQGAAGRLPRATRRHAGDADRALPAGVRGELDPSQRRLLRLGEAARPARRQGHAGQGDLRPGRLRAWRLLLRRRPGRLQPAAVVLLPTARAHPRGRAPPRRRGHRGAGAAARHRRPAHPGRAGRWGPASRLGSDAMTFDCSVAVIAGGLSFEREISLRSGRRVADAPTDKGYRVAQLDAEEQLVEVLRAGHYDAAFIALHGRFGEDGQVAAVLELLGLPYTGSSFEASRLAFDKLAAKSVLRRAGLTVPPAIPLAEGALRELGVGTLLERSDQLPAALMAAFGYDDMVLLEQRVSGTELALAVVDGLATLPAVEIRPKEGWYDFAARYTHGATDFRAPAALDPAVTQRCLEAAHAAHLALGCRDLSRVDAILDDDGVCHVLEVNTGPGLTSTSLVPMAADAAGISFTDLAAHLTDRAVARRPR